ncbi:MAG: hypothetical protein [Wendovervirus sonii]|uniref:Uncharacterized protein n=1 Tax=phage Lak_Megaphage_Sonny TaxID=3109229 RepID=A0ABZ0Z555_9CAUD|nr:MAG: hypothetical protein [phage Lak_Megaphage_Sonny]
MRIFKRIYNFFASTEKIPVSEKIKQWLLSFYGINVTMHGALTTNSIYYAVNINGKKVKIRISDHMPSFNKCNIYVMSIKNNNDAVAVIKKSDRNLHILNYRQAISFIQKAVNECENTIIDIPEKIVENSAKLKEPNMCISLPTTLAGNRHEILKSLYHHFNEKNFMPFIEAFEKCCGNIGYKHLSKEIQLELINMFNINCLNMGQIYGLFAYSYNHHTHDIEKCIKFVEDASKICQKNLTKYKGLCGHTIAFSIEIELYFMSSTFFNGITLYDNNFNQRSYRVNHLNECIQIMCNMFPWVSVLKRQYLMEFHNIIQANVTLSRIIECLMIVHNRYPDSDLITIFDETEKFLKKSELKNIHWDFKNNIEFNKAVKIQAIKEPFEYHYQKPELIISKEEWLDLYDQRAENKEKLNECLSIDIKNFDKYTKKQKLIVDDLLSYAIPYEQCIKTINNSFWTTKSLQTGCEKLKKIYKYDNC